MTMEQCKKSGKDAHVEEQMISLMLHREDAAVVVGSTLGRLAGRWTRTRLLIGL